VGALLLVDDDLATLNSIRRHVPRYVILYGVMSKGIALTACRMICTVQLMNTIARSALIVDGLELSLTSDDLTELFTPFGTILWTQVVTDPFRRSLGFGYVVMETDDQATRALQALHGHSIAGRVIRISRSEVPPLPRTA